MQLNPTEMRALQGAATIPQMPAQAFQLPTINAAVPHFTEIVDREVDFTTFARALLDAGVIQPDMIGPRAGTPKCILEQGLRAWFKERTDRIKHLKFDVRVCDAVSAADLHQGYDEDPPEYKNWVFALEGYETSEVRIAEPIALELEKKCPGLFYSAFSEMEQGAWRTIDILTPTKIIEQTASYMLWDGDFSEMPTDEQAMEYLVDRYGEEADRYLPSALVKVWGQGFCFPREGQKTLSARKLKKLSKSDDAQVATISHHLLKLREAKRYLDECGAKLMGVDAQPLFTGCSIGFNRDDRYTEFIDAHVNGIYESGEYSEYLSIDQLPSDPDDLDSYFIKLDALFRLMAEVDALIPLLSHGDDAE
jgi:PRTRC genetic system protein F